MPRIDSILRGLGSGWDVEGAVALSDRLFKEFKDGFTAQGAHEKEAVYRASKKVAAILTERSTNPAKAFIRINSDSDNAEINLYMDGGRTDGTFVPVTSEIDTAHVRDAISAARAFRFNKDKITVNLLSEKSEVAPKAVTSQLGGEEVAFTFLGGNGIYLFPEKIERMVARTDRPADFFSTDTSSKELTYKHLVVHESGHLQMYKLWGDSNSSGRKALEGDFKKFGVSQTGTSLYGDESVSESFAEQ